ncbi:OmpA family protein [Primorskyibacter sp. S87]|uniref:OmpA family protein n=1 Tax=Primorskyibacter sp. S87 TaxID=3415126 RepID=UPI003C7D8BC8
MRISSLFVVIATFLLAAVLSTVAASFAVTAIEDSTEISVRRQLDRTGHGWAEVQADGLQVVMSGTAPDEAARFTAISQVGSVVDAARIIDQMDVTPTADIVPPRFLIEILRNDSGISLIGLIPEVSDRDALIDELSDITRDAPVIDLLETADYPVPNRWPEALRFAKAALSMLPRSKISVSSEQVSVTAITDSAQEKERIEARLTRRAPAGVRLALKISAPRPVITPFTLRYLIDETGGRFDACSAESTASRDRIVKAAISAGLTGPSNCVIGMGVPSPNWPRAAEQSISALAELGAGSVTIADADITLVAAQGTDQSLFDKVVGELETSLPDVFALHAVLPEPETVTLAGPPEFTATLSPEGLVQLRGRVNDETLRQMADSYAKSRFGSSNVHMAARVDETLPSGWPVRVLAGLEALSILSNGAITVTPDELRLRGSSSQEDAKAIISRLLSEKLGQAQSYELDVTYRPPPPPEDLPPDPGQCEADLAAVQANAKIAFEPGSATVAAESLETLDRLAEILTECAEIRMEIQGHTDSQGREEMNLQLSQSRAQSVLNELRSRRVLTSNFSAIGYGESRPIADNGTPDGREENRRIEFHLIRPEPIPETPTTLEASEQETAAVGEGSEEATPTEAEDQGTETQADEDQ